MIINTSPPPSDMITLIDIAAVLFLCLIPSLIGLSGVYEVRGMNPCVN